MEKEIFTFKERIEEIIDKKKMKLWLSKKIGKRVEYIFKVGQEQFSSPQKIAEDKNYILLGQGIDERLSKKLEDDFNQYLRK